MKTKSIFLLCLCALIVASFFFSDCKEKETDSLIFANVEALATGESNIKKICLGIGPLDCHGEKVQKITSYIR